MQVFVRSLVARYKFILAKHIIHMCILTRNLCPLCIVALNCTYKVNKSCDNNRSNCTQEVFVLRSVEHKPHLAQSAIGSPTFVLWAGLDEGGIHLILTAFLTFLQIIAADFLQKLKLFQIHFKFCTVTEHLPQSIN